MYEPKSPDAASMCLAAPAATAALPPTAAPAAPISPPGPAARKAARKATELVGSTDLNLANDQLRREAHSIAERLEAAAASAARDGDEAAARDARQHAEMVHCLIGQLSEPPSHPVDFLNRHARVKGRWKTLSKVEGTSQSARSERAEDLTLAEDIAVGTKDVLKTAAVNTAGSLPGPLGVLAGAGMGAALDGIESIANQAILEDKGGGEIDYGRVLTDAAIGGLNGAVGSKVRTKSALLGAGADEALGTGTEALRELAHGESAELRMARGKRPGGRAVGDRYRKGQASTRTFGEVLMRMLAKRAT